MAGSGAEPKGLRVLIVDDDIDSAEVLDELLRSEGHEVRVAHDGLHALSEAAVLQPQVILLETLLRSAEMTAYELCRRLARASEARPRIIAFTSHWKAEEAPLREAGFDAHLEKPIQVERLFEVISAST